MSLTPPNSPTPGSNQTNRKAWVAGVVAAIVPIVLQNLAGVNDAGSAIWDYGACQVFGTVCPEPMVVSSAFKSIVTAVGGGIFTGLATWWINNKPKEV